MTVSRPSDRSSSKNVSRETLEKLELYQTLLVKWQKAINLVSKKTLDNAWERHFEDSLQLLPVLPEGEKTLYDLGSGAGFPGLVLAIARPDLDVHLIESDGRKCEFLRTVSRETKTPVTIHNARIEALSDLSGPDIITVRALTEASAILNYCEDWLADDPLFLLLKGEKAAEEMSAAGKYYAFEHEEHPSKTDPRGCVAVLSAVKKRT